MKSAATAIDYVEIDSSRLNGEKVIGDRLIRRLCEESLNDAGYVLKRILLRETKLREDYAKIYRSKGYPLLFLQNKSLVWLFEIEENGLPYMGAMESLGSEKLWILPRAALERPKRCFLRLISESHAQITSDIRSVFTNYLIAWRKRLWLICGLVENRDCGSSAVLDRYGRGPVLWRRFRCYLF